MRLTAVVSGDAMHVAFTYHYSERERAWNLATTLNRMGTPVRDNSNYPTDRWVLSRHQKDQLRKHLHGLDWPDLTFAFTEEFGKPYFPNTGVSGKDA